MSRFNVLYLTSELHPMAKVGGLADVAGALPKVLKDLEHDVRVFIPKYRVIRDRKYNLREVIRLRDIEVPLGNDTITVSVKSGFVPDSKVQAYFLEYKPFFDRDDIYVDPKTGKGFEDDALRFALFAKASLEMLKVLYWQPDLIHVNDWPSALAPYFLKTSYAGDEFFAKTRSLITVHNLAYQGDFPAEVAKQVFDKDTEFNHDHPAWHHGRVNFLKAGLVSSDLVTTVSPTYAKEILSEEYGAGLDGVLRTKEDRVYGVLNGIDPADWNPETDKAIEENFTAEDLSGKAACKTALLKEFKLDSPDNMLVGVVSRLVTQKGFDLLVEAADKLMEMSVNLVILGTGEKEIEAALSALAEKYPGRISVSLTFDNELAHRIEAGSDAFLMPSRYEPCGLNQMYSLAYGTAPIARATGGLIDTVEEFDTATGSGTGFLLEDLTADALVAAVAKAVEAFGDKAAWGKLIQNGMAKDFSWTASAKRLIEVYKETRSLAEA